MRLGTLTREMKRRGETREICGKFNYQDLVADWLEEEGERSVWMNSASSFDVGGI